MNELIPKTIREFFHDVRRAASKDKKSVIMSMKKAQDIAEALERTFGSHDFAKAKKNLR